MGADIYAFEREHQERRHPGERAGAGEDCFRYPAAEDPWEVSCGAEDERDHASGEAATQVVPPPRREC